MSLLAVFSIDWTQFRLVTAAGAGLCCFILGFIAYRKNRAAPLNRAFAFFNFWLGLWNWSDIAMASNPPPGSLFYDRLSYVFGTLMVPNFLAMTLAFAERPLTDKRARFTLNAFIVFLLAVTFTPWLIQDVKFDPYFIEVPGPLYAVFILYILGWMGFGVVRVIQAYRHAVGIKKNQLRWLGVAFVIVFGAAVSYIASMVNPEAPPVFYVLETIYNLLVGYTIIRYKLMDITLAFRYGTIIALLALIVGVPFALLLTVLPKNPLIQGLVTFLAPLLGYLAINKLKQGVTTVVDNLPPFKGRYDQYREDFIQAKRESILNAASIHLWAENVLRSVKEILGVEQAAVLVHDASYNHFVSFRCMGLPNLENSPVALETDNPVLALLNEPGKEFLLKDDLSLEMPDDKLKAVNDELKLFSAHVCVPLWAQGKLAGILMIGAKRQGDMFNNLDVRSLGRIKSGAEDALRALLSSLSQGEFSSSFAHDLMHPFGPKGSFQLLAQMLNGKLGTLSPEQEKTVSLILKEAGYVWKNLGNVLNPRKYMKEDQTVLKDQALAPLFERTRIKYGPTAEEKGVRWTVAAPPEGVQVRCDADDLEHRVIVNLVDNAFRYVKEGGSVELGHQLQNGSVTVYVKDTGPGVPPDKLEKLFVGRVMDRGENGGKAGWGLYNAKTVVEAHGGRIWVDNEPGRGASFCFQLPVVVSSGRHGNVAA